MLSNSVLHQMKSTEYKKMITILLKTVSYKNFRSMKIILQKILKMAKVFTTVKNYFIINIMK